MTIQIPGPRDFYSGLIFTGFAAAFLFKAREYPLGNALSMGPSYFPGLVAMLLALVGLALVARGVTREDAAIEPIGPRVLGLIVGAVIAFGLLIDTFGLVPAAVAMIAIASFAGDRLPLTELGGLVVVLVGGAVLLFHSFLGVPFRLVMLP